ncbi:hypothetical protein MSG28_002377 [Choristoneura fumiferana]|uniref:Uncharacterized protein n=1 Tax=Choristoneura fumiferana TaxID=7141 RepID=A0ACC0JVL9_CHOFU|nr:hypothetical protein MSG28_002377 [Choristoneura fumiferana]
MIRGGRTIGAANMSLKDPQERCSAEISADPRVYQQTKLAISASAWESAARAGDAAETRNCRANGRCEMPSNWRKQNTASVHYLYVWVAPSCLAVTNENIRMGGLDRGSTTLSQNIDVKQELASHSEAVFYN